MSPQGQRGGGCRVAIGGWVPDEETAQWAPEEWVSTFQMEVSRQDFRHRMWDPLPQGKGLGVLGHREPKRSRR